MKRVDATQAYSPTIPTDFTDERRDDLRSGFNRRFAPTVWVGISLPRSKVTDLSTLPRTARALYEQILSETEGSQITLDVRRATIKGEVVFMVCVEDPDAGLQWIEVFTRAGDFVGEISQGDMAGRTWSDEPTPFAP